MNEKNVKTNSEHTVKDPIYLITQTVLNDLFKYLLTKPYGEVVKFMGTLTRLEQLDPNISASFVKRPGVQEQTKNKSD